MAETGPWSERQLWGLSFDNADVRLMTLEGNFSVGMFRKPRLDNLSIHVAKVVK